MALPGVVVHRVEGHATGLYGPRPWDTRCAFGRQVFISRLFLSALDCSPIPDTALPIPLRVVNALPSLDLFRRTPCHRRIPFTPWQPHQSRGMCPISRSIFRPGFRLPWTGSWRGMMICYWIVRRPVSGGPLRCGSECLSFGGCPPRLGYLPGCQYQMTSYDNTDVTDVDPTYGLQLHHPCFLEYVGAPESVRLLSRPPGYRLHHMDREEAVSAALQLQHDAGLMMTIMQVLGQFVTSLNRMSSEVMRLAFGQEQYASAVVQAVSPSPRIRRASHYMTAMGLWHPPGGPGTPGPLPTSSCNNTTPHAPPPQGGGGGGAWCVVLSLGRLIVTYVDNCDDYIPVKFLVFGTFMWLCSRTTIRLCFIFRAPSWGSGGF